MMCTALRRYEAQKQEAERVYKLEQEQRYNERHIRKYKRLSKGSLDPDNRRKYADKLAQWQDRQKRFIAENGDVLKRRYENEVVREMRVSEPPKPKKPLAKPTERGIISSSIASRHSGDGRPSDIALAHRKLNKRQSRLLERLPDYGSEVIVKKSNVSMADLAALSAETDVEYAMFTKGGKRLIVRGSKDDVPIDVGRATRLAQEGYRWSGHTHAYPGEAELMASDGDYLIQQVFGKRQSVIYNVYGEYSIFEV